MESKRWVKSERNNIGKMERPILAAFHCAPGLVPADLTEHILTKPLAGASAQAS